MIIIIIFWKCINLMLGKDFSYSFLNIFISDCSPPLSLIKKLYIFMLQLEMNTVKLIDSSAFFYDWGACDNQEPNPDL